MPPPNETHARPTSGRAQGRLSGRPATWAVPEETPVAFRINCLSHAVMMATPADLRDFAFGFLLAEGLVDDLAGVEEVEVKELPQGIVLRIAVAPGALSGPVGQGRATAGFTGCGLCGVETLEAAVRAPKRVPELPGLSEKAVLAAMDALPAKQALNIETRSVHAAAWCDLDGRVLLVREDVGRHNALDKLIGARAQGPLCDAQGFVAMSSRCSFELVQKAATAGISALATVSAPTALALRLAGEAGMTLMALNKGGGLMTFAPQDSDKTTREQA